MKDIKKLIFERREKNEEPIMLMRRHWFVIAYRVGSIAVLFIISVVLYFVIQSIFPVFSEGNSMAFLNFAESFAALMIWAVLFVTWIDYYFDVWIITNRRVINIEQKALFSRFVSELKFSKIQDVTTEVHGLIPTLLDYGDVYVQTAGEKERFIFRQVPHPNKAKELLIKLQERMRREETDEFGEVIKEKFEEGNS